MQDLYGEIEKRKDGVVPIENVVQYLKIMSQDNRMMRVRATIDALLVQYQDTDITLRIFTVS